MFLFIVLSLSSPLLSIKLSELEQARIIVLSLLFLFNSLLPYGLTARHHEHEEGGWGVQNLSHATSAQGARQLS